ncbi:hypothetical protein, partial [Escherichia coli]|uniref:hypothetical protein n=1 Tax=Escherichia coli TaxID=562 RepID=UPI003B591CDF
EKRVFLVILFTSFSGSLVSRIPGAVHGCVGFASATGFGLGFSGFFSGSLGSSLYQNQPSSFRS